MGKKLQLLFLAAVVMLFSITHAFAATITANVTEGCAPLEVSFSVDVAGTYYDWYFDNGYSSSATPTRTFTEPGTYNVEVHVLDASWNSLGYAETVIHVTGAKSYFEQSFTETCTESFIQFDAGFEADSYAWDLGDGTTSTSASLEHSYATAGTYPISLIVATSCGTDTIESQIEVFDELPTDGYYDMSITNEEPCPGEEIDVFLNGYANDGEIVEYIIDLGDGTSVSSRSTSHAYEEFGKYYITATFINNCGGEVSIKDSVTVGPKEFFQGDMQLQIESNEGCTGTRFRFVTYSTLSSVLWEFGDGTQSNVRQTEHYYNEPGKYAIRFTGTDFCGTDTVLYDTIIVSNEGFFTDEVYIAKDISESCPGGTVKLSAPENLSHYEWDLGEGRISNSNTVNTTLETIGKHPISLTVVNSCNKDTTIYDTLIVTEDIPIAAYLDYDIDHSDYCPNLPVSFNVNKSNLKHHEWNFGDGSISRKANARHTYFEAGEFPITLSLENWCGNDTIIKDTLEILEKLPMTGNYSMIIPEMACPNEDISFSRSYVSGTTNLWDFGDGSGSTSSYPNYSYSDTGTYVVSLTYTDACGSDTTVIDSLRIVEDAPIGDYYMNFEENACPNSSVSFSVYGDNYQSAVWNFGDGSAEVEGDYVSHSFDEPGNYDITVEITAACGGSEILSSSITIRDDIKFTGNFNVNIAERNYVGRRVYFSLNNWYSRIEQVEWDFGDGFASTTENAEYEDGNHVYYKPGNYVVTATATNACGDQRSFQDIVTIIERAPIASISINKKQACPGESIYFSISAETSVKNCKWTLSNGYTYEGRDFEYMFSEEGLYKVTAEITDYYDNSSVAYGEVRITSDNKIEEVEIDIYTGDEMGGYYFCPGESIPFWVNSNAENVRWDFGDGNTSSSKSPNHSYAEVGTYIVSVSVTNSCGDTLAGSVKVNVTEDKEVGYLYISGPSNVCPGQLFRLNCWDDYESYSWDLGDGTILTDKEIFYSFEEEGTHVVKLTVTNSCGNSMTTSRQINVTSESWGTYVGFSMPSTVCVNSEVSLICYNEYTSYTWDFGDGQTATGPEVTHTFTSAGAYQVEISVEDECGNTITERRTIQIYDNLPILSLGMWPSVNSACPGETVILGAESNESLTYSWDFGDGSSADGQEVEHSWSAEDNYKIALIAENACGDIDTIFQTMEVGTSDLPLSIDAEYTDEVCTNDEALIFFSALEVANVTHQIDFGDGTTTSTLEEMEISGESIAYTAHGYAEAGEYLVTINASNSCGQSGTESFYITVGGDFESIGDVYFSESENYCVNDEIEFIATNGVSYSWNWGDGSAEETSTGTLSKVSHQYTETGTFNGEVVITNGCGNTNTAHFTVVIECEPDALNDLMVNPDIPVAIFPNPAVNELHVNSAIFTEGDFITIHNLVGEIILQTNINGTEETLNIADFKSGIYLIKIHTSEGVILGKFLKE